MKEAAAGSDATELTTTMAPEAAAAAVAAYFQAAGYRIERGTPLDGVYGTGSNLKRMLLGAFAKRFLFGVAISPSGAGSTVTVRKAMSGNMGGIIGNRKMTGEYQKVASGLAARLGGG